MTLLDQTTLLKKYHIDEATFTDLNMTWEQLTDIYHNYINFKPTLFPTANRMAEALRKHPDIHTVKARLKDPERLIAKIIRKSIESKDNPNFQITLTNYQTYITDLIGIRVLHLYKNQAVDIDQYIRSTWTLAEKATIYYRKGDNETFDNEKRLDKFDIKEHPAGYRSWHYLIESTIPEEDFVAEVQVRTIFEEGWSEIDHQLRYPYDLDNSLLQDQLLVLNRVAGSADEMANAIRETQLGLDKLINENEAYKAKIKQLSKKLDKALKDKSLNEDLAKELLEKIDELKPNVTEHFHKK